MAALAKKRLARPAFQVLTRQATFLKLGRGSLAQHDLDLDEEQVEMQLTKADAKQALAWGALF